MPFLNIILFDLLYSWQIFDAFISTGEAYSQYNEAYFSAFFRILMICGRRSSRFRAKLMEHNNFRYVNLFLASCIFPLPLSL